MLEPDQALMEKLIASFPDFISQKPEFERGLADVDAMMALCQCYGKDHRVICGINFHPVYREFVSTNGWAFRDGSLVRMAATFFRHRFAPKIRAYLVAPIVRETDTEGRVMIVHGQGGRLWVCCETEADSVVLALALSR